MPAASRPDAWVDELPDELRAAAERNAAERVAQGLHAHVDDPVVLDRCARILTTPTGDAEQGSAA